METRTDSRRIWCGLNSCAISVQTLLDKSKKKSSLNLFYLNDPFSPTLPYAYMLGKTVEVNAPPYVLDTHQIENRFTKCVTRNVGW